MKSVRTIEESAAREPLRPTEDDLRSARLPFPTAIVVDRQSPFADRRAVFVRRRAAAKRMRFH